MILTDGRGRPIDPPEPPAPDAPIEETVAYLRAYAAYKDRVADIANRAFDEAFREALRK